MTVLNNYRFSLSKLTTPLMASLILLLALYWSRHLMIAHVLGVGISTVASWLWTIYRLYRGGAHIRRAIALVIGGGVAGVVGSFLLDMILSYGIERLLGSGWLQSF